jgi:hypothetical protein
VPRVRAVSTLRAALSGRATLRDLIGTAVTGVVITICYGCAGSKTGPDGRTPCRRCGGTGIDPNPN